MSNLKSYYFVAAAVTYSGIPRNFYDACTYEYTTPNAVQQRESESDVVEGEGEERAVTQRSKQEPPPSKQWQASNKP
jgi:hypothetical protein